VDVGVAVVAAVFACGTCGGPDTRFVSYLEKYSDALRQAQAAGGVIEPDVAKAGHLIRAVDGADWVPSSTGKAIPILEEAQKRCGTQTPVACQP
jgi:hypothetical protein